MTGPEPSHSPRQADSRDHPDGRVVRGDNRRAAILEAATREFGRRGYESARIADIARTAGVTDAGLLHHFATKRILFLAVVDLREQVYGPIPDLSAVTARMVIDGLVAAAVRAEQIPYLLRFRAMLSGANGIEGHPVEGRAGRNLRTALAALEPVFAAAVESGELQDRTDPRQVALELLALNDGIRSQWAAWPDGVPYAETFATAAYALYERIAAT